MKNKLALQVRTRLSRKADSKFRDGVRAYFKEQIRPIGVRTPECIKIAKAALKENGDAEKAEILQASEELLAGGIFEEGRAGIAFLEARQDRLGPEDLPALGRFLQKYVHNWAWCDWLCTGIIGRLFARRPELATITRKWRASRNRWVRRASVTCFVPTAKKGLFHGLLLENADAIFYDSDDLVRKGTGWALREAAKADEDEVVAFLLEHADGPRITLRYAIERMDEATRKKILAAAKPRRKNNKQKSG